MRETTGNRAAQRAGSSLTVRRLSSTSELEELKPIWNDLVDQSDFPTIFQTFEWVSAWWEAYGSEHSLYVIAVEYGARVVGLAPLMLSQSGSFGRKQRVLKFIGTPQADYGDFIGPDKKLITKQVLEYLRGNKGDWTELNLSEISERSSTVKTLQELLTARGLPHLTGESETCHSFVFEGDDSERATFAPKKSKRLRRSINWFTRKGSLELEEIRDPEELGKLLPGFFHAHVVRWTDTFRPSMFLEAEHRRFYRELVRWLGPLGRISFFVLRFKGQVIAYEFNFLYRNRSGHYTITHDMLHHNRSVGRIINHKIRDYYIENGLEELDFSRGAHEYKDTLSNRSHVNYRIRLFSDNRALRQARWYEILKATRPVRQLVQNKSFSLKRQRFAWLRHTYGLKRLLATEIGKVVRKVIDVRTVSVFGCPSGPIPVEPVIEVQFARLDESHIDEIASFAGAVADSEHYRDLAQRLAGGADCFVVRHHGYIVSLGWGLRQKDTDPDTGFSIEPNHKQVLLTGCRTSPVVRGLRLRRWLIARQVEYYRSRGLTCIAAFAKNSTGSTRVMRKMQFEQLSVFRQIKLFGQLISGPGTARVSSDLDSGESRKVE